jgi:hypothetical protein
MEFLWAVLSLVLLVAGCAVGILLHDYHTGFFLVVLAHLAFILSVRTSR